MVEEWELNCFPRLRVPWGQRDRHDRDANQKRVAKVQRRHRCVLIAEAILGPHRTCPFCTMHRINKSETLRDFSLGSVVFGVAQQSRRHARPQREDHKCKQIGDCHSPPSRRIQMWTSGRFCCPEGHLILERTSLDKSIARDSIVV